MYQKLIKKSISILLVCILMLGVVSGCKVNSNGSEGKAPDSASTTGAEKTATGQENNSSQEAEPKAYSTLLSETPVTLKYLISERADAAVKNDWPTLKAIAEMTNVTIEFEAVPGAGYTEKKNILIATNSLPDLAAVSTADGRLNGINGVFYDMKDLIATDAPHIQKLFSDYPDAKILATGADGGVYSIPSVGVANGFSNAWLGRMDLIKEYGLEIPETTSEFYQVLKVFKEKNPGSYPIMTRQDVMNIIGVFLEMFVDVRAIPRSGGGGVSSTIGINTKINKYEFSGYAPEFKEALTYINKLFAEELIDPEFLLKQSNQWEERLLNGKSFFTWDNRTRADQFTSKGSSTLPTYDMDFIPLIVKDGKKPVMFANPEINPDSSVGVSSKTKNAKVAVKFIDFLYSYEGSMFTNYGIEGVTYDMVDGKPVIRKEVGDPEAGVDPSIVFRRDYGVVYDGFRFDTRPYQPPRSERYTLGSNMYAEYMLTSPVVIVDTEEEGETKKEIKVNLDKYIEQEITKFVMGTKEINDASISEFIEGCKKLRLDEYLEILNNQYARALGK